MRILRLTGPALLLLVFWQGIVTFWDIPNFILPGPLKVAGTLWHSRALIAENALVTMTDVLAGLGLGGTSSKP